MRRTTVCMALLVAVIATASAQPWIVREGTAAIVRVKGFCDWDTGKLLPDGTLRISNEHIWILGWRGNQPFKEPRHELAPVWYEGRGFYAIAIDEIDTFAPGLYFLDVRVPGTMPVGLYLMVAAKDWYDANLPLVLDNNLRVWGWR